MKGFLYIDNYKLGEVDFKIIDESMGGIGGVLIANDDYKKYQPIIQEHYEKSGISNMDDFSFRILLADKTELIPMGGVGVTDSKDFDEIYVELTGLDFEIIEKIKNAL
jgi:hypothetical protein